MVAEHELLRQPRVERDHRVVVDLRGQRRVVAHRVVHPRVAVVGLVEVRGRGQQRPVVRDRGTPGRHRRRSRSRSSCSPAGTRPPGAQESRSFRCLPISSRAPRRQTQPSTRARRRPGAEALSPEADAPFRVPPGCVPRGLPRPAPTPPRTRRRHGRRGDPADGSGRTRWWRPGAPTVQYVMIPVSRARSALARMRVSSAASRNEPRSSSTLVDRDVHGGGDVARPAADLLSSGGPELVTPVLRLGADVQDHGACVLDGSLDILASRPHARDQPLRAGRRWASETAPPWSPGGPAPATCRGSSRAARPAGVRGPGGATAPGPGRSR